MNFPYVIAKDSFSIAVYPNGFKFEGDFFYIYNREIVKANRSEDFIDFNDYIGSHYLKIRSEKKLGQAIIPYFVISLIKSLMNIISDVKGNAMSTMSGITEPLNEINSYYQSFNKAREILEDTTGNKLAESVSDKIISFINGFLPFPIPPTGINIVFWILQIIAVALFIRYFISKKSVYEFSAINKRIAIDMNKLDKNEYMNLLYLINEIKRE